MIPRNLPKYVERGGRQVWCPPYRAQHAKVFGFVLGCDRSAIDKLLLRDLVEPAGGAVDYRCAQERMLVLFASIERLTSGEDPDRLRGYVPELEVSLWCLAADVQARSRLVWYLPYVFVDSGQATASGREVYGYPKQLGVFQPGYPDGLDSGGATTVEAMAIHPYAEGEEAALRPMISAKRLSPADGQGGGEAFSLGGILDLLGEDLGVTESLPFGPAPKPAVAIAPAGSASPQAPSQTIPRWAVRRVLDTLVGRRLVGEPGDLIGDMVDDPTLVFLKQFRDASCPTKACYQAIVEAPLAIDLTTAAYEGLDSGLYEVTIEDWDSHPIATELGVAARTPLRPEAAFQATLDFDIQLGLEVWRAQT